MDVTGPGPAARASTEAGGAPASLRGTGALAALAALGGAALCFVTGENLPVGLLPQLSSGLGVSLSAAGLLVTIYAVVVITVSAPLTRLTRGIPRRPLLAGLLGTFALATLAAAAAPSYAWLVAARVVIALAQAIFWSIVAVVAVGLVPAQYRGRAVALVFAGSSIALILGIPAATWLGQQVGWRLAFVGVAGLGLVDLAALALLLPSTRSAQAHAAAGTHPDARRYRLTVLTTILCVGGSFTAYTYVTAFLTRVSGLPLRAVAPVLLLTGLADAAGVVITGLLLDRHPVIARVGPVAVLCVSLFALFALGSSAVATVVLQACAGIGLSGVAIGAPEPRAGGRPAAHRHRLGVVLGLLQRRHRGRPAGGGSGALHPRGALQSAGRWRAGAARPGRRDRGVAGGPTSDRGALRLRSRIHLGALRLRSGIHLGP
jgi:DHA1 family inner membrane transport protein